MLCRSWQVRARNTRAALALYDVDVPGGLFDRAVVSYPQPRIGAAALRSRWVTGRP
jgi:hypothetical protein